MGGEENEATVTQSIREAFKTLALHDKITFPSPPSLWGQQLFLLFSVRVILIIVTF